MARNLCVLYPEASNGKPSQLYRDLLKMTKNRPLTNYIYAVYLANSGIAAQMSRAGYGVDKNGEHRARDVHKYLEVAQFENEGSSVNLDSIAKGVGAKDARGNTVDFTDANQALSIAEYVNQTNDKVVASVIQVNDVFSVVIEPMTSRTLIKGLRIQEEIESWRIIDQMFNLSNIDLSRLDFARDLVNPLRGKAFLQWLNSMGAMRNSLLTIRDIKMLLTMNENGRAYQLIDRLKSMFGGIDDVAQKIYDAYRAPHIGQVVTQQLWLLIDSTMNECKRLNGLNVQDVMDQVDNQISTIQLGSSIKEVEDKLEDLRRKYKVDNREVHKINQLIKSLSDAAEEALYTLLRQIRDITESQGVTQLAQRMEGELNSLITEIASNNYYNGLLGFLQEALTQALKVDADLIATPAGSTNMEVAKSMALTLRSVKNVIDGYRHIVDALSNMDNLIINGTIATLDRQRILGVAQLVKDIFDKNQGLIESKEKEAMTLIAREYLGDSLLNGTSVNRLVELAAADSSLYDYLYSVGRVSNPLIATMGSIIREAQDERTKKLVDMSKRIRTATGKLYRAGYNTEFMYDEGGYIISDIDWTLFNKARRTAIRDFKRRGYKGLQLKDQIDRWEEAHMEDRVVDANNGRTEKVPNYNYRKPMPFLTYEQQEYYDTMMQIRGEIGSMLPNYALRHHYIAPQLRRSFVDAMGKAIKARSFKKAGKAVKNKFMDMFVVREDDTDFAQMNGVIDGEDYVMSEGALDNTPLRRIPLFYMNIMKDLDELLKDFSGGLQALAGTAINFQCMNEIKDTVEFMGDFIKGLAPAAKKDDQNQAEAIVTNAISFFKDLVSHTSNSHTLGIVDGFIDKHLYGIKMKDTGKWVKFAQSLLSYTSLRSLAVNVKGAISNYLVGELLMLIEAGAGEFYGLKDYAWAHTKVFGDNTIHGYGRIMDFMTNNRNSEAVLLALRFDPLNEEYGELSRERYYKGPLRHLLGKDFSFIGYGAGEHMIHYVTMYAILNNVKVKIAGKDASLYDAFYIEKDPNDKHNSVLKLKDDVTYLDLNGSWLDVDDAFLDKIRNRIRYCNLNTHGSMNEEDKGLIHQHMLGRFAMNLRQWMVEHYSRRYRGTHFDATLGEEREGYYNTVGKFILELWKDHQRFNFEIRQHWNQMTTQQKANFRRAISELAVLFSLIGLSFGLGEPDEHKKDFWMRMWIYQVKRAIVDVNGSQPLGIPMEITTLLNSPIAATNTVNALMYPFTGLGDIDDTIQRGDYAGWNKYGRNMLKYWVPFYHQIDLLQKMDEDDSIFAVFDNTMR